MGERGKKAYRSTIEFATLHAMEKMVKRTRVKRIIVLGPKMSLSLAYMMRKPVGF